MPNLNPNGLLFSTVTTFVEQVGRRKQWKYGDLDVLVCTFNGPTGLVDTFRPKVNAKHPQYPLMFCTDSQVTDQAGLISEYQATYQGIIQTNGASKYLTPGIVSTSPVQGSRDFQLPYKVAAGNTGAVTLVGPSGVYSGPLYNIGTQRLNIRYVGSQASVRYQAYPRPSPNHPNYSGLGLSMVQWEIISEYYGEISITASGLTPDGVANALATSPPGTLNTAPPIYAIYVGMQMQQRGLWYDVTENYAPTF